MLPATAHRVADNTCESVNEVIRRQTEANIARFVKASPATITARLKDLDQEWDVERCVETIAPTISLVGMLLAAKVSMKWLVLPAVVQAFLLQHGMQGWCPPVPILRRLGVRTIEEIDQERYALKTLRGDFRAVSKPTHDTDEGRGIDVIRAVRM